MRMKEVCARTGLTDRAVRLYIESGLITPACERNYAGRASIHFDEADIATLETVATLRRAGFAIADIAAMQRDPACIPALIAERQAALDEEIAERKATRAALARLGESARTGPDALAAELRAAAPSKTIPKEDTAMRIKEIEQILRVRLAAVLALVAAVVGVVNLARLTYEGCFLDITLRAGGGYDHTVNYGLHPVGDVMLAWLPTVLITGGALLLFVYIARGRRWSLLAAIGCLTVGTALILAMPAEIAQRIHYEEFIDWHYSFLFNIYWNANSTTFEAVTALPKFIPLVLSLICSVRALVRDRSSD